MKKLFALFASLAFGAVLLLSCDKETPSAQPAAPSGEDITCAMPDSLLHSTVWRMVYLTDSTGKRLAPGSSLIERCWLRFLPDGTLQGYGALNRIDGTYSRNGNAIHIQISTLTIDPDLGPDPFCDYLSHALWFSGNSGELVLQCSGAALHFVAIPDNLLLGSWRWVETYASIEGMGSDPQNAGFEFTASFGDSLMTVAKNDTAIIATPYRVQNARVSDCMNVPLGSLLHTIVVDIEATNAISLATNTMVTVPFESIITFEINDQGRIFMAMRENSCAGYLYVFEKQ